jgi:hypothetical protein
MTRSDSDRTRQWLFTGVFVGVLVLVVGMSALAHAFRVDEVPARPERHLILVFPYLEYTGLECGMGARPWYEVPAMREHRDRISTPIMMQMKGTSARHERERRFLPSLPISAFSVCVDEQGEVVDVTELNPPRPASLKGQLRLALSDLHYAPGPARCYKDWAWVVWNDLPH